MDTSSLIDGIKRYYRPESFPNLWGYVDEMIEAGRFFVFDFVAEEVKVKDDDTRAPGAATPS